MLLGDGKKSAKLTRDGVDVKEQGRPPVFYPWGAGEDEARIAAEQAQALAEAAQATAEAADGKATTAQVTAEGAQTKAAEAAEAAANAVQKTVPENKHRQTAGISLSAQNNAWSLGPDASRTNNYLELWQDAGEPDRFMAVRIHTQKQNSGGSSSALLRLLYKDTDSSTYKVELKASKSLGDVGAHTFTVDGVRWRALSTLFIATLPANGMFTICVYTDGAEPPRYMIASITKKGSTHTLGQILGTYGG